MQGLLLTRVRRPGRSSLIPSPPWYYSGDLLTVEYRTDPARVAELLPAPLEPGHRGSRCGRPDLGRLAVLLVLARGAARPGALAVQGGLRRRALLLPGPDVLPLRLHLGRQGLRHRPRHAPGLPEEARLDVADPAAPVRRRAHRRSGPAARSVPRSPPATGASPTPCSRCARSRRPTASSTATRWRTTGSSRASPARGGRLRRADRVRCEPSSPAGPAWTGDVELRLFDSPTEELSPPDGRRDHRRLLPAGGCGLERRAEPAAADGLSRAGGVGDHGH